MMLQLGGPQGVSGTLGGQFVGGQAAPTIPWRPQDALRHRARPLAMNSTTMSWVGLARVTAAKQLRLRITTKPAKNHFSRHETFIGFLWNSLFISTLPKTLVDSQ